MEPNNSSQNNELIGVMAGGDFAETMPALDALLACNQQYIGESDLMRSLINYRKWFAPFDLFSYNGKTSRVFDETLVLTADLTTTGDEVWIFTDEESAHAANPHKPFLGTFVGGIRGIELRLAVRPTVKTIRINPHSPAAFSLTLEENGIRTFRIWGAIVACEERYVQMQQTGKPDVENFDSDEFWVFDHSTGPIITLPNRSGMKNPAAAFTAPDCVEKFLAKVDAKLRSEIHSVKTTRRDLMQKRREMGIDGLIINVYGPGASSAVSFDLLDPASAAANLAKHAFIILYYLASGDGAIDEQETRIIADFLKTQPGGLDFDVRQTVSEWAALSFDGKIKEYQRALFGLKNGASEQDRLTILHFAFALTKADGMISEGERFLFQDMARNWDIDLDKFFADLGIVIPPSAPSAPPVVPGLEFVPDTPGRQPSSGEPNKAVNQNQTAVQFDNSPKPLKTIRTPIETLAAYGEGQAGVHEVLRSLVSHRGWFAPLEMFVGEGENNKIDVDSMVIVSPESYLPSGELWLFADLAAVLRAQEQNAPIGVYAGAMSGTELFGKIPADIKSIRINRYSPHEQTWSFLDETSVELARLWSEVIVLEEKIEQWQPDEPDLTALGDYRGFVTVVNAATNGIFLIKEFSEEMRVAAPIFTAPDSAEKFLKNLPPEKSAELKQITINGDTLLNDLPNMKIEMPNNQPPPSFDGAVINAYGPGAFYILRFSDIVHKT